MKVITYDFETFYSQHDYTLSKMGPIEYIRDPRFDAFMVSMAFDGKHPDVWCNTTDAGAVSKALHYHIDPQEDILVGHNSTGFDALILSERFNIHPRNVWDTICLARWAGISSVCRESHASLTEKLGNGIKQAGTVVSNDKHWPQDFTESEQTFFKQYCLDDTAQCQANLMAMLPYVTDDCLRFMSLTARMATEPVFELDAALLEEYIKQLDAEAENARQKILELFHFHSLPDFFKAIRSKEKFAGMLRALGVEPPTKVSEKKTTTAIAKIEAQLQELPDTGMAAEEGRGVLQRQLVEVREQGVKDYAFSKQDIDFLALTEHEDPRVRLLVETRLEFNSSVMRSRAETLLKFARYGKPLPIMLSAFLAHTSRYTAGAGELNKTDGTQMQNLSKHNPAHKPLRKAIKAPRGMKVVAVDSSQIECRFLAWMAGQEDLLRLFKEGKCPYSELAVNFDSRYTAEEIYKGAKADDPHCTLLRQAAKKLRLSCLAGDTQVLTDTGWKRIDTVSVTDKLWDGESWVQHQGLICNGKRKTIVLDGVRMTPDHLIWNGTFWNMAGEYQSGHACLSQALLTGGAAYWMCDSKLRRWQTVRLRWNINWSVLSAEQFSGFLNGLCLAAQKTTAVTVLLGILNTLKVFNGSGMIQSQGIDSESLPLFGLSARVIGKIRNDLSVVLKLFAPAGGLATWFYSPTLCGGRLGVVMSAPNVRLLSLISSGTVIMPTSALTPGIGGDCWAGYLRALTAAIIQKTTTTPVMGGVVCGLSSLLHESFSRIYSLSLAGTIRCLKLIVSTMRGIMPQATFVSAPSLPTCGTAVAWGRLTSASENCRRKTSSYENVYDIMNCGPRNRFLIKTASGCLLVHNCQYGTGRSKFADTLWKEKTRLAPTKEEHDQLAFSYHQMYRVSSPYIVKFWSTCEAIIEALVFGYSGVFGGPGGNTFTYGRLPICGRVDWAVPSIMLPSGYALRYPNLRAVEGEKRVEYVYDVVRGGRTVQKRLYGASLTENLTQAISFQLLMWQACRMDEAGIAIKGNNHDCWFTVVPEARAQETKALMEYWMCQLPEWAKGLPIAAEGKVGDTFEIC